MKLSTRSRYGLRMMQDLAQHYGCDPIILREIAKREEISEKYLSKLIIPLKAAKLVAAVRGSRGGYSLTRHPYEISIREIIETLEGDLAPVECIKDESLCGRAKFCTSRDIWSLLEIAIRNLFDGITLGDMVSNNYPTNDGSSYCI